MYITVSLTFASMSPFSNEGWPVFFLKFICVFFNVSRGVFDFCVDESISNEDWPDAPAATVLTRQVCVHVVRSHACVLLLISATVVTRQVCVHVVRSHAYVLLC